MAAAKKKRKAKSTKLHGFLDGRGREVVAPDFEDVSPFSGGGAWVVRDGRWGRIGAAGEWLVEAGLRDVGELRHGLRPVLTPDRRAVWIDDQSGEVRYDGVKSGQASDWALDPAGRYWGNQGGNTDAATRAITGGTWQLYAADHEPIGPALAEGLHPWWLGEDHYIATDERGVWRVCGLDGAAISPGLTGSCFGISAERLRFCGGGFWGAYDLSGRVAIAADRFTSLSAFDHTGLALAGSAGGRVAIVDIDGEVRAETELGVAGELGHCAGFERGFAQVSSPAGGSKQNLIGHDGRWQLDVWAQQVEAPDADGWYIVKAADRYNVHHVDSQTPLFDAGQAWIGAIPGWGFAAKSASSQLVGVRSADGAWVIEPRLGERIEPANEHLVRIRVDGWPGRLGLIRRDGTFVGEPIWDDVQVFDGGVLVGVGGRLGHPWGRGDGRVRRRDAKWSLLSAEGELIAELGKQAWQPGPLREDRMAFCPAKSGKSRR